MSGVTSTKSGRESVNIIAVAVVVVLLTLLFWFIPAFHSPLPPPDSITRVSPRNHPLRRGTIVFQAAVRGRAARSAALARNDASSTIAAWWRARREAARYLGARRGMVALQSVVRGRRGREEVAARWLALGRRFSKHKAATMIQVLPPPPNLSGIRNNMLVYSCLKDCTSSV